MLANRPGTALAVFTITAALGGCFSRDHPDFERYEYLFIEGAFQHPYAEFPSGTDRANWKCYDGKTNREFDCTFVHRGWADYQYIYRRRR